MTEERLAEIDRIEQKVLVFGGAMMEKFAANIHKGRWDDCDPEWLLDRLQEELTELREAVANGGDVRAEAADVANFALMIADVAG
jgi:NTP pyrophosphatase (non-canonical NTP hydrolase)